MSLISAGSISLDSTFKRSTRDRVLLGQSRSFDGLMGVPEGVVPASHHVRLVGLAVAGRGVQRVLLANCHHLLCKLKKQNQYIISVLDYNMKVKEWAGYEREFCCDKQCLKG